LKALNNIKNRRRLLAWMSFFVFPFLALSQSISIDEDFTDWTTSDILAEDPIGDAGQSGIDLNQLWIANDSDHLFIRFNTGKVINLQQNNLLRLFVDIDNDPSTGDLVNGIGADLFYDFGMREGKFILGNQNFAIEHPDIGLHSLPTVTSNEFELAISRKFKAENTSPEMGNTIAVCLKDLSFNGDQVPTNPAMFQYSMKSGIPPNEQPVSFLKPGSDQLRVVSYNSLFDGFFDFPSGDAQARIIQALNPDIIAFQEIYNHTANETAAKIETLLPLPNNENWYRSKVSPDIICVSKYPIVFTDAINGNGIFILEVKDTYVVLVNAHLPCCDNDEDRQQEIDFILYNLKELKNGNAPFQITDNSPIIIVGDMNLVGEAQQQQSLITGDIINEMAFGSDLDPDWNGGPFKDANPPIIYSPFHITWSSGFSSYPPGRLDYQIYTPSVLEAVNSFVLQTTNLTQEELTMYGLEASDSESGSDHFPVIVDYKIDSSVPVKDLSIGETNSFQVYPNPVSDILIIEDNGLPETAIRIELYNSNGLLTGRWAQSVATKNAIDVSDLPNGIYNLRIIYGHKLYSHTLSILHP
jgi:endonuclease/exonuclease/phosphatase family metal-dependent hydrolase